MDKLSKLYRIKKTLNIKPPLGKVTIRVGSSVAEQRVAAATEVGDDEVMVEAVAVKPWCAGKQTPESLGRCKRSREQRYGAKTDFDDEQKPNEG